MSIEEKFQAAVSIVQTMPKSGPMIPTNNEKLMFYSLYKQATEGENKKAQPGYLHFVEKAKWQAWKKLGEMPPEEARKKYINLLKLIIEKMSQVMNVDQWLQQIDPMLSEKLALILAK